jgi:hypothetical protein
MSLLGTCVVFVIRRKAEGKDPVSNSFNTTWSRCPKVLTLGLFPGFTILPMGHVPDCMAYDAEGSYLTLTIRRPRQYRAYSVHSCRYSMQISIISTSCAPHVLVYAEHGKLQTPTLPLQIPCIALSSCSDAGLLHTVIKYIFLSTFACIKSLSHS